MNLFIDELQIFFPYAVLYKEQLEYMKEIKRSLDMNGHAIIEMPTGTGKTVSILSLISSYIITYPEKYGKLIYCTRTVAEMEKTLKELKFIEDSRKKAGLPHSNILACGLSARRNLCIHPEVSSLKEREKVDAGCRKLTAEWVRFNQSHNSYQKPKNPSMDIEDIPSSSPQCLCKFYEGYVATEEQKLFDSGVLTLEDLKKYGENNNICPYYLARKLISSSTIIVYNYMYLLDPKISEMVTKEMKKDTVVLFDEAHNIDDVCIEALTVRINRNILEHATKNLENLKFLVEKIKDQDLKTLEEEYRRLEEGLSKKGVMNQSKKIEELPKEVINQVIPGNIRKNGHFINFMKKIVIFLKNMLKTAQFRKFSTEIFLTELSHATHIDSNALKFTSDRFKLLLNDLKISETDEYIALLTVSQFSTLVATPFHQQFALIFEPNPADGSLRDPLLSLACLDSSLAMKPIFEKFKSVILTSGTMSPMEIYPKLLDFKPLLMKSIEISLSRNSINPLIISKGSDQNVLTSEFAERNNKSVVRNYGNLLIELCGIVPDGIVCFFPSYKYMEDVILQWNHMGILDQISEYKLMFIESKDVHQTSISLMHYRRACDCGRGAVFLSIARGKVAEGIDFEGHYGRCVVMFGVPLQYTKSNILIARLEYLLKEKQIKQSDFLIFDAMRQCAQCVGRVIRGKNDYGLMIFADKRYSKNEKREKLPRWIKDNFTENHLNMSIDVGLSIARDYFKRMAQPFVIERRYYFLPEDLALQKKVEIPKKIEKTEINEKI